MAPDDLPGFINRRHFPGIPFIFQNLTGLLDPLLPAKACTISGQFSTQPELVAGGYDRIHPGRVPLNNSSNDKVLVNKGRNGPSEVHVAKRQSSQIKAPVVKGTSFIRKQPYFRFFFKVFEITRLNAGPEHVHGPFFKSKDGGIGCSEKFENNPINVGAQHPAAYFLTGTKEVLVFLDKKKRPLTPFLQDKRTGSHRLFYLMILQCGKRFFAVPGLFNNPRPLLFLHNRGRQCSCRKNRHRFLKIEYNGSFIRGFDFFYEFPPGLICGHLELLYESPGKRHVRGGKLGAV